jgi:hypothetical protein
MNRRLVSILVAVCAAGSLGVSLTSCNAPSCGPGTTQKQQSDGTLKCVPVDSPEQVTPCDVDAGNVVIVGGKCVSAVQCDPGTTMNVNGICVGTGGGGGPMCGAIMPGKACVQGTIFDFTSNAKNTVSPLHVDLYDPITLLSGGAPLASTDLATDGGAYAFQNFTPPGLGLIVILTGRTNTTTMVATATGAQGISGGNKYTVDAYSLKQSDAAGWGFDITTGGGYIAKFYKDPKPAANLLINNETMKVAGVTLTKDGPPAAGAKYFNDTLTAIDPALTVTGTSGVAIVASPIPTGGMFPVFSGTGPTAAPITWEQLPGGSAAGLVFVTRFHPNM